MNIPLHQAFLEFGPENFNATPWTDQIPESVKISITKRKNEYVAGRLCARQALKKLGAPHHKFIPKDGSGLPVWPHGVVGSITHTRDFALAAVASQHHVQSLGIDAENWIESKRIGRILDFVATADEISWLNTQSHPERTALFTLLFSAKESLFKCLVPLVGKPIGFLDVEISIGDLDSGQFEFKLLRDFNPSFCRDQEGAGRFRFDAQRAYTLVCHE